LKRTKTISWDDPQKSKRDALSAVSGLDYLKAIKEGRISPPPVAGLVGYTICEVDNGYAAFELDPGEHHYNPFATVHGGILSTLLDTAMTASVLSALPKGVSCTTIEIKVNFIRPVSSDTGILTCEARPLHLGKKLATVEGKIKDNKGVLYAHGSSTCSIFEVVSQ
jgi:uncharacterized protein (TIGR00369 family)